LLKHQILLTTTFEIVFLKKFIVTKSHFLGILCFYRVPEFHIRVTNDFFWEYLEFEKNMRDYFLLMLSLVASLLAGT